MKKQIRSILAISLICILSFCIYNIYIINNDYNIAKEEYESLSQSFTNESTEVIVNDKENIPSNTIKEEPITNQENNDDKLSQENNLLELKVIDFNSLTSLNSDIIGWITIPGTKIDYPILHSNDNKEYLHLTFLKEESSSGSIFVDKNNSGNFSDYNTIIYGHNMKNGSMFSLLKSYKDEEFYKQNKYIQIYTPESSNNYKIISCYETYDTSDSYNIDFSSLTEYEKWLQEISNKSDYKTENYDFNKNTITLSTCIGASGQRYRWVVHLQKVY